MKTIKHFSPHSPHPETQRLLWKCGSSNLKKCYSEQTPSSFNFDKFEGMFHLHWCEAIRLDFYFLAEFGGFFFFQTLKKYWTHQTLKINGRHNKILQCLPTAFEIKSHLLSMTRKPDFMVRKPPLWLRNSKFLQPLNKTLFQSYMA